MGAAATRVGRRDTRGMSVIELMVVTLVLGIVMASLLGLLGSMTANERAQQARVDNQEQVRLVLGELERDLRAANPMVAAASIAESPTTVEMALGPVGGPQSFVRWTLEGTTLSRSVLIGEGSAPSSTKTMLTNVRNAERGVVLLRYFSHPGVELATTGAAAVTAGDVANCTILVKIALASDPDPRAKPFVVESGAEIRNRLPGGLGC